MAAGSTSADGGDRPPSAARVRLVALAIFLGVGAVLAVAAMVTGGSDERASGGLRVERYPGPSGIELVLYVEAEDNLAEVADNRSTVRVECVNASGAVLVKGRQRWPFRDTDGGTTDAHVHQQVAAPAVGDVKRCRLADTEPLLQGPVTEASIR